MIMVEKPKGLAGADIVIHKFYSTTTSKTSLYLTSGEALDLFLKLQEALGVQSVSVEREV